MKRKNFIMVFALVAFGFMACNDESVQLNTNEPEAEINLSYEEIFAKIANDLGVDVTFETVEVFHGFCSEFTVPELEVNRMTTRNFAVEESWDIDNSTMIRATTSLGESFTTIATPHMDTPSMMSYVMMSSTGEAFNLVADVRFDEINGTMFLELMEEMGPIDVVEINGRAGWRDSVTGACIVLTGIGSGGGLKAGLGAIARGAPVFKIPGWGQLTLAVVGIGCVANEIFFVLPPPPLILSPELNFIEKRI